MILNFKKSKIPLFILFLDTKKEFFKFNQTTVKKILKYFKRKVLQKFYVILGIREVLAKLFPHVLLYIRYQQS